MSDVVYVAVMVVFVAVTALFLTACDKIIGPDATALEVDVRSDPRAGASGEGA